jgi:hypothetical protein
MPTATALNQKTKVSNIMDRAVCLIVNTSRFGNSKKVHNSQVEIDADKDFIRVQKTLLDSPELKQIISLDGEIRRYLYSRASMSPFTSGVYLLANDLLAEVEDQLQAYSVQRDGLIEDFIQAYPALLKDAEEKLSGCFNRSDYPSQNALRAYFSIDWNYWNFSTSENLKKRNQAFYDAQLQKNQAKMQQAAEELQQGLRAAFADLVSHASERLSGGQDGKPKIFRDSMLANINDFLSVFQARNITDDSDLSALVDRAKSLVQGVDPSDIRTQEGLRSSMAYGFAKIKAQLDTMITDRPGRKIRVTE